MSTKWIQKETDTRSAIFLTSDARSSTSADAVQSNPFSPDQMAGYTVTALMVVINLLVAYVILKRFVFKPLIALLAKRREMIEGEIKEAEAKLSEAETRLQEAEAILDKARIEAGEILSEARAQADKKSMLILKSAQEESDAICDRANDDAKRIRQQAVEHMREDVADFAVHIAQKLIGCEIDEVRKKEALYVAQQRSEKTEVIDD